MIKEDIITQIAADTMTRKVLVERLFTTGSLFIGEHDKITVLEV